MNKEYHERLMKKLSKASRRINMEKRKTSITLTKCELEDLYFLWKHEASTEKFKEIFDKEMKFAKNTSNEEVKEK